MRNVTVLGMLVLFMTIPAASASEFYLIPDNTNGGLFCNNTTVEIWINATEPVIGTKATIQTDSSCGNIVAVAKGTGWHSMTTVLVNHGLMRVLSLNYGGLERTGHLHVGSLTIHCNSTSYNTTDVSFVDVYDPDETYAWNASAEMVPTTWDDGTFTCGGTPPVAENFSKPLYEGWNLISLPLDPVDSSAASAVLSTVLYDAAVYRYNATSSEFESIESTDAMNPGTGYFVHATSDCIWNYSGYAYDSMDIQLKDGLNMIGWLNCTKGVDDALSSISGDYYYVARWNTQAQRFEVYNPVAPPDGFNDITTMNRGTGYFISARDDDCTVSENC